MALVMLLFVDAVLPPYVVLHLGDSPTLAFSLLSSFFFLRIASHPLFFCCFSPSSCYFCRFLLSSASILNRSDSVLSRPCLNNLLDHDTILFMKISFDDLHQHRPLCPCD